MRLVSYAYQSDIQIGAVIERYIIDLQRASQIAFRKADGNHQIIKLQNMMTLLASCEDNWTALFDIYEWISKEILIDPSTLINLGVLIPEDAVQLLAPLPMPGKIICIAGNFPSMENQIKPEYPTVFMKPTSTINGPEQPVLLSDITTNVAIEVELGIVIGKLTRHIPAEQALKSVAGYLLANDIGDRVIEKRTSQWTSGKMFDSFTPIGPRLVTKDEIPSPNKLEMISLLNGELVQKGNTSDMFFRCEEIISYLSDLTTLQPGDIILMGSPKCIGNMPNPEVSLADGDIISISIEGLGELTNPVLKE